MSAGDGSDLLPIRLLRARRREREVLRRDAHRNEQVFEATRRHDEEQPATITAYRIAMGDVARSEDVIALMGLDNEIANLERCAPFENPETLILSMMHMQRASHIRRFRNL